MSPGAPIGFRKDQEEILQAEYRTRFDRNQAYRRKVWHVLCCDFFSRFIPAESSVLDVGCGWGEFINQIDARCKSAMDLNPDAAAKLNPSIRFFHQNCSEPWPIETASLDVIFSSNFLEHLADKSLIESTLAEAHRALRPGGIICLMGPNIRFAGAEYWDFWDHHIAISDRSMAEVLKLCGFQVIRQVDRFLPFTMSEGRQVPMLFVRAYLRMPVAWRLFGKQFLILGQK
jgi:SAM-dependent methyltransferase